MHAWFSKTNDWRGTASLGLLILMTIGALTSLSAVHAQPSTRRQTAVAMGAFKVDTHLGPTLRDAVRAQLVELPDVRHASASKAHYVVNASVIRLTTKHLVEKQQVGCEVSVVVADGEGTVKLMLSGRSVATGTGDALKHSAVRAAVRGAMRPLGKSLKSLR